MQAIIFALLSFFGWAFGDIFGTIAVRRLGTYSTAFWILVISLIPFSFYIPFAWSDLAKYTTPLLFLNLVLGIFEVWGNVLYNEAFRVSNVALIGAIGACYPIITLIESVIFLKEAITATQILIVVIVFVGVILAVVDFSKLKHSSQLIDKGAMLALVVAVIFWSFFSFLMPIVRVVAWFWPPYLSLFLAPLILLFLI